MDLVSNKLGSKLVLHPNPISQWHALVTDACADCTIKLSTELESYLVFLLMRSEKNPVIASRIIAETWLLSNSQPRSQKHYTLQDVGDTCLIFTGLFPELAKKRRVQSSYYTTIGQTAYANLSAESANSLAELFASLSGNFALLTKVLNAMRHLGE
jgi:hypothetical protein